LGALGERMGGQFHPHKRRSRVSARRRQPREPDDDARLARVRQAVRRGRLRAKAAQHVSERSADVLPLGSRALDSHEREPQGDGLADQLRRGLAGALGLGLEGLPQILGHPHGVGAHVPTDARPAIAATLSRPIAGGGGRVSLMRTAVAAIFAALLLAACRP
jgi:hypothetical protein